jgi:hypothetical protein
MNITDNSYWLLKFQQVRLIAYIKIITTYEITKLLNEKIEELIIDDVLVIQSLFEKR